MEKINRQWRGFVLFLAAFLGAIGLGLMARAEGTVSITYSAHVQNMGWQDYVSQEEIGGTEGQGLRMEALAIRLLENNGAGGGIEYRTHCQDYGWTGWNANGEVSGTTGESKRLEAVQIRLTGDLAVAYDVYYKVHVQDFGWLGWVANGQTAGTTGLARRMEAFQAMVVPKGTGPAQGRAYMERPNLHYSAHVQNIGDQEYVSDGQMCGTEGQDLRMEALTLSLDTFGGAWEGDLISRAHVQDYGWGDWTSSGSQAGTRGEGRRLEAVELQLTGELADTFDIYYRANIQNIGWLDWASNGQTAGSTGQSLRMEALEVRLVPKGAGAPMPGDGGQNRQTEGIWQVTQYPSVTGNQSMFYTLTSQERKLIIIDGGWKEDEARIREVIGQYNNKVDLWICTHFHGDHVGGPVEILKDPRGIEIKELWRPAMDDAAYDSFAKWWDTADISHEFLKLTQDRPEVKILREGDVLKVQNLTFEVFSAFDYNIQETYDGNNCGLLFKVTANQESMLFCSDIGVVMSDRILGKYGDQLKADYVQMGHHGNGGLSEEFYRRTEARAAFFDAPDWLMYPAEGTGYTTPQNRAIMESMGAEIYSFSSAPNHIILK